MVNIGQNRNPYETRIVVTGMGTVNPIGNDVNEFWTNLLEGKSGVRVVQNYDLGDSPVRIGGEIDLPDLTPYFREKRMIRRLDRNTLFAHAAGTQALKDSGIEPDTNPTRYGSLIGSGDGGVHAHFENISRIVKQGVSSVSPFYIINAILPVLGLRHQQPCHGLGRPTH
jgi:3-oxoacyl-[acyl-carrier-protein] synthase II